MVAFRNREVVWIVGRRTFHRAGSEFDVDVVVADDRQFIPVCRVDGVQADQMLKPFIVRMHNDANIAEHRFRPGRRNLEAVAGFNDLVVERIHRAFGFLMDNLDVAQRRLGRRIPVDNPLALIDQAVVVVIDKNLGDGFA